MAGKVVKIRPDIDSTGATVAGMLAGHAAQVKHIMAVVIWEDDSYQVVNDPQPRSQMAFAITVLQKRLLDTFDQEEN